MDQILNLLVKSMIDVGKMNITGEAKKRLVLSILFDELEMDSVVEELLEYVIDLLIKVENGKLVFNTKLKQGFLSCCSKR
tara:strand:- start:119 stop:358 length:240 start_codon:yes stop_codon:yes gene_type:complete